MKTFHVKIGISEYIIDPTHKHLKRKGREKCGIGIVRGGLGGGAQNKHCNIPFFVFSVVCL